MALIKCKECGKEISDSVKSCPHCGYIYKKEHSNIKIVIICLCTIIVVGLIGVFIGCFADIKQSFLEYIATKNIIGEYTLVSGNESLNQTITITKENLSYACSVGSHKNPFVIYIEEGKQYVYVSLKDLGSNENGELYLEYQDGKLVSKPEKYIQFKCPTFITDGGEKSSNLEIEYQKNS